MQSANKVYKVLGALPDKAEEIALERLNNMCLRIREIYAPGARCMIVSDGLVYNGLSHSTRTTSGSFCSLADLDLQTC
jgi:pyoverdine/dityrosine biosynthesis protein Dit1